MELIVLGLCGVRYLASIQVLAADVLLYMFFIFSIFVTNYLNY